MLNLPIHQRGGSYVFYQIALAKLLQGMFCLLLAGGPAAAQTVTGTISGTVVDDPTMRLLGPPSQSST